MTANDLQQELYTLKDDQKALSLSRFFKTGKGQYGEGDKFLGINVPTQRTIAKKYREIDLNELQKTLSSEFHELRLTSFLILTLKYSKSKTAAEKREIFNFYLKNISHLNNWDLIDTTAPNIIGEHLLIFPEKIKILYELANSDDLWKKRIAILSTFTFIKKENFKDTLKIAEILVHDRHDLIHKAVGWMLREIANRDSSPTITFLNKHYRTMPRTMLRYAIEKFPKDLKSHYMKKP